MIKILRVLWGILLTGIGFSITWLVTVFIEQWGIPIEDWHSFKPYVLPMGVGIGATFLYEIVDIFLKINKAKNEDLWLVGFTLPSGEHLIELQRNKDDTYSVRVHTNLIKLLEQFKSIYKIAHSVDHQTFTRMPYGFNIMRPYIIAVPHGEDISWAERFRIKDTPTEVDIPFMHHKSYYLEVSPELFRYVTLDLIKSLTETAFPEESKQDS